ncbi:MAG: metal ABC transporter permease [Nitrospirae bacterium]|nr:MAG: metal ABC transporter permease [Nitrospirota bacterium]
MSLASVDASILGPPLAAGLLVLLTHVPFGRQVLARGIIFLDLSIAQLAGLGAIAAHTAGWGGHAWQVQAAAVTAALGGAVILHQMERRWPNVQEALIGVLFVTSACLSLLLLAGNPQGGEHLKELLVGQILWVSYDRLGAVAVLYAVVLALWAPLHARMGRLAFYLLFAVTVTASVQLVGVYLVFASLILPALAGLLAAAPRHLRPVSQARARG